MGLGVVERHLAMALTKQNMLLSILIGCTKTFNQSEGLKPAQHKVTLHGRGGGEVVSVLAFYSDDLRSNPTDPYSFFSVKFVFEKNENKQKEACVGPL